MSNFMDQMPYSRRRNHKDIRADNTINRWREDRVNILLKNCSFDIEYLGWAEMPEHSIGELCFNSITKIYEDYKTGVRQSIPVTMWITEFELRIVEKRSKNLVFAKTVETLKECASFTTTSDQFLYLSCTENHQCVGHLFIVKNYPADRLRLAIEFVFVLFERLRMIRQRFAVRPPWINPRSSG